MFLSSQQAPLKSQFKELLQYHVGITNDICGINSLFGIHCNYEMFAGPFHLILCCKTVSNDTEVAI